MGNLSVFHILVRSQNVNVQEGWKYIEMFIVDWVNKREWQNKLSSLPLEVNANYQAILVELGLVSTESSKQSENKSTQIRDLTTTTHQSSILSSASPSSSSSWSSSQCTFKPQHNSQLRDDLASKQIEHEYGTFISRPGNKKPPSIYPEPNPHQIRVKNCPVYPQTPSVLVSSRPLLSIPGNPLVLGENELMPFGISSFSPFSPFYPFSPASPPPPPPRSPVQPLDNDPYHPPSDLMNDRDCKLNFNLTF